MSMQMIWQQSMVHFRPNFQTEVWMDQSMAKEEMPLQKIGMFSMVQCLALDLVDQENATCQDNYPWFCNINFATYFPIISNSKLMKICVLISERNDTNRKRF